MSDNRYDGPKVPYRESMDSIRPNERLAPESWDPVAHERSKRASHHDHSPDIRGEWEYVPAYKLPPEHHRHYIPNPDGASLIPPNYYRPLPHDPHHLRPLPHESLVPSEVEHVPEVRHPVVHVDIFQEGAPRTPQHHHDAKEAGHPDRPRTIIVER